MAVVSTASMMSFSILAMWFSGTKLSNLKGSKNCWFWSYFLNTAIPLFYLHKKYTFYVMEVTKVLKGFD
jgi:hypothetical protein